MARRIKPKSNGKKSNKSKRKRHSSGNRAPLAPAAPSPEQSQSSSKSESDSESDDDKVLNIEKQKWDPETLGYCMRRQMDQLKQYMTGDGANIELAQKIYDHLNKSEKSLAYSSKQYKDSQAPS